MALLQGSYSEALYGARGRVDVGLRILWVSLLPAAALEWLATVGVCPVSSVPPWLPFYAVQDAGARGNPIDALWLHAPDTMLPLKSYSWAEITRARSRFTSRPIM